MNPEDKIKNLINGIGAMAEVLGVYRTSLLQSGFSCEEAFKLSQDLEQMIFEAAMPGGDCDED